MTAQWTLSFGVLFFRSTFTYVHSSYSCFMGKIANSTLEVSLSLIYPLTSIFMVNTPSHVQNCLIFPIGSPFPIHSGGLHWCGLCGMSGWTWGVLAWPLGLSVRLRSSTGRLVGVFLFAPSWNERREYRKADAGAKAIVTSLHTPSPVMWNPSSHRAGDKKT